MRKIFLIIFLQGVLMSLFGAMLESVEVDGKSVPMIYERDDSLPIAYLKLSFSQAGSIKDGELDGLSRFSARMLNEGTKELGGVRFAEKLEEKAIRFSAGSGTETIAIEFSCLQEYFNDGVKLVTSLLKSPNLTADAYEKVKVNTQGSISKKEDDFDYIAQTNLQELLFASTPLQLSGLGTKESIEKIKLKDIEDFLKENLTLSRAMVVVGGKISLQEAKAAAKELLSTLKLGKAEECPYFEANGKKQIKVIKKETQQAYIFFGAPLHLKPTDPDAYKARVAGFILGASGFGSRMMEEIRVKHGLAYSAYGKYYPGKSGSQFSGHLQTALKNEKKAKEMVAALIDDFIKNGATEKELESAKKFILGSEPLRVESLSQRLTRSFNEYYNGNGLGYTKKELELISALTLDELNSFIKSHKEIGALSYSIVTK